MTSNNLQPTVDRSKQKSTVFVGFLNRGNVLQEPFEFEGTKVGMNGKAGLCFEVILVSRKFSKLDLKQKI